MGLAGAFERRVYRLGDELGPGTMPQGDGGIPAAPSTAVLFDFDPAFSLDRDRVGGIALTDPVGGVARVVANGRIAAEFSGSNYLLGASSPFAALSDLTGGVSIYVVWERTDALVLSKGVFWLAESAGTNSENSLGVNHISTDYLYGYSYDAAGVASNDRTELVARDTVEIASFHATTTLRTAKQGGYGDASATVTARDPASMDSVCVGGWLYNGGVTAPFPGRIYRVLVCEGAFDQTIADYLADLYVPRRLPPMVSPADVVFLWDARNGMYRDTLNGINLTPTSAPYRVARAGDVAAFFDGTDDELAGTLATAIGTMSGDWTAYVVAETAAAGLQYLFGVDDADDAANSAATVYSYGGNAGGASGLTRRVTGSDGADLSGATRATGVIVLHTGAFTSTTIQAFTDGVSNGSTADTKAPTGIDSVTIGSVIGSAAFGSAYTYYVLLVNSARDAAVETWLTDQFKPLRLPPSSVLDPADIAFVWDPRHDHLKGYGADLAEIALTAAGSVTMAERGGTKAVQFAGAGSIQGPLPEGDLDATYTIYTVREPDTANGSYAIPVSIYQVAAAITENLRSVPALITNYGVSIQIEEAGAQSVGLVAGEIAVVGTIQQDTVTKTPTEIQGWKDGTAGVAVSTSSVPRGTDRVAIGYMPFGANNYPGYAYYVLMVRGARDTAIESWINANWAVGTSP